MDWYMDPQLMEVDTDLIIFENSIKIDSPCLALSFAILNEALYDLTKEGLPRQEALAWFFEDDYSYPFSFVNIANNFNINPEAVRDKIYSTTDNIAYRKRSGTNQWTNKNDHGISEQSDIDTAA